MALLKLRSAKDGFLLDALEKGRLILNQNFPEPCNKQMPLAMLQKIMGDGFLFYYNGPEPVIPEPTKQTEFTPMDVILHSHYGEFPDCIVTLKLAAREAVLEGRDPDVAMRRCASRVIHRVKNKNLQGTLWKMISAEYPSNLLVDIESAIKVMVKHLREELGETIYADGPEYLAELLFQPR